MPSYTLVLNTINALVIIVGVPSLTAALIYIGRQFEKLDTLTATMEAVKHNVNLCTFALIKMNQLEGDKVQTFSPALLTREGDEYLEVTGVKSVIDDKAVRADLFDSIKHHDPQSRYDVEVLAINAMFNALTDTTPMMHAAKVYLYNHPYDRIQEVAYLSGLYLRDRYLEAHPEIAE
jgi:hypothetical protein